MRQAALVRHWQQACPPFATPQHDAAALAGLLLWRFPAEHGVTSPLADDEWEGLLGRLRQDSSATAVAAATAGLCLHAPGTQVAGLLRRLQLEYCAPEPLPASPPQTADQVELAMSLLMVPTSPTCIPLPAAYHRPPLNPHRRRRS